MCIPKKDIFVYFAVDVCAGRGISIIDKAFPENLWNNGMV